MKRLSKKEILEQLASAFTTCDAHCDDTNPHHRLAVRMAYLFWNLTDIKGNDMSYILPDVVEEIKKL